MALRGDDAFSSIYRKSKQETHSYIISLSVIICLYNYISGYTFTHISIYPRLMYSFGCDLLDIATTIGYN